MNARQRRTKRRAERALALRMVLRTGYLFDRISYRYGIRAEDLPGTWVYRPLYARVSP
jgi:hypothetical protein